MTQITLNLNAVHERIALAAKCYNREPSDINLLAVSKKQPVAAVLAASAQGQRHFGENFVQEAIAKRAALPAGIVWHFIGQVQSNKTRAIADNFDWLHTLDRLRVARRLDEQRAGRPPLNVCLQVNLHDDDARAGVRPDAVIALARDVAMLKSLRLRGLMTLPPQETGIERQRQHFRTLARLARDGRAAGLPLEELSMGMSNDLEAAVAEGATWVRLGTAVFGPRP